MQIEQWPVRRVTTYRTRSTVSYRMRPGRVSVVRLHFGDRSVTQRYKNPDERKSWNGSYFPTVHSKAERRDAKANLKLGGFND